MTKTFALLAALLACAPALADGDHDRARRAVEEGRILPLTEILARARNDFPGELIEAELEDEHQRMVYELKIVTADGRVVVPLYDAATGELLRTKRRGHP